MYKTSEYIDYFENANADMRRQFDMLRKLSKNFTVENKIAIELDEMLMQFKKLDAAEQQPNTKTPKSSIAKKKTDNPKVIQKSSLEDSFEELFEVLKGNIQRASTHSPGVSQQDLKEALSEALKDVKIGFGNLDKDVQKRFLSVPIVLSYEIQERKLPAFTKPPIEEFQQMVDDLVMGNNILLVGGAGTGKTFTAENLLAKSALGRKCITINCSQWTSPTEIIGGQTMDGYTEGKLIEAWQNGLVLILDELPKIDPNTAGLFNDALAKTKLDGAVIFNARKESFVKHPDFACIATGNIYPDKESISYGANNKQDLSLLDRFSGSVYFIEKNPAIEKQILQNDMVWSICDKVRSIIEELKYEAQLSLRFMQTARDAYALEMTRLKSNKPNRVQADEGKTFKSAMDSYLSTFTEVQRKNIMERMQYSQLFTYYEYRKRVTTLSAYQ